MVLEQKLNLNVLNFKFKVWTHLRKKMLQNLESWKEMQFFFVSCISFQPSKFWSIFFLWPSLTRLFLKTENFCTSQRIQEKKTWLKSKFSHFKLLLQSSSTFNKFKRRKSIKFFLNILKDIFFLYQENYISYLSFLVSHI